MSRWEERKKERDAASKRSKTPYVAPEPTVQRGVDLRRGGGVRNREPFELPSFLQPRQISTPSRGRTTGRGARKPKEQNPAAPPQAARRPGVGTASLSIPANAAVPGTGPKGNQTGDPSGSKDQRVNANGLVSYGKDLSSLNAFTSAFTGGYEIADIKSSFQSNDLPTAYQNGSNKISTEETPYELPDGASPSNVGGKYSMGSGDISIENTGYKINPSSVPGTVGGNPSDPQDGTSDKPDVADKIRQVRMARSEGSPRGFNGADFSGAEPDNSSLVSPMYANAKRNKIRSTFLDHEGSSVQAIAAANAVAGYGKDSNADARFNVGGELVYAKDGMQQKAKNAAMMGQDPTQFLDIPTTPDTQPDTPAASELSPTPASTVKPGTIQVPENKGGSIEVTAPMTTPSPAKFKEAQDFLTSNMEMLTRRTK